jgi:putative ABC transport system substrate-binding protein
LEIFRELLPTLRRVIVLTNPANPRLVTGLKELERVAPRLGVGLRVVAVRDVTELDKAFAAIKSERAGGLIVEGDPILFGQRARIIDFANQHRLPAIYGDSPATWVRAGGLMAYGPSLSQMYRAAAGYIDKVLRGAKAGDLPVQRPMKFEFVINLKTAKQIGLTVPQSVLYRADEVIK